MKKDIIIKQSLIFQQVYHQIRYKQMMLDMN